MRISIVAALVPLAAPALAQTNAPVSVSTGGSLANNDSYYSLISADGRYVVFQSEASNLAPNDFNGKYDIFRRDLQDEVTKLVSVNQSGAAGNGLGLAPAISGDGRYVAWQSDASNLVAGDTNGTWDVFLRDMELGVTTRISLTSTGAQAAQRSDQPRMTPDARYVTFESDAALIPGDTNGQKDCYRLDRTAGTLELVSTSSTGAQGNSISYAAQPSDDGRYVCFFSSASNLVAGDTNGQGDVFWKDMQTGALERVNVSTSGAEADSESIWPSISGDGQTVTFCSRASTLVGGDTNNNWDLFARDVPAGVTTRLNVQPDGNQADSYTRSPSALSFDGRYVIYASLSTNLVPNDTNDAQDIFIRDRSLELTERVSVAFPGNQTNSDSFVPHMTPDAQVITFTSNATNVVPGDTNGLRDIFASTLGGGDPSTPICFGDGSGTPCPCGNDGAAGEGCANSMGAGALLSAGGDPSLSDDTLVLFVEQTTNQPGIVFQGDAAITNPPIFGDGIRCCGQNVIRIGTWLPSGNATDTDTGNLVGGLGGPISAHPGNAGLQAGDGRCYQWWYRDPSGSPCGGGFNLSNALLVTWTP